MRLAFCLSVRNFEDYVWAPWACIGLLLVTGLGFGAAMAWKAWELRGVWF